MAGGGPERTFISTGQDITDSVDLGFAVAAVPRQHHRPPSFTGVDDTPSVISVQMGRGAPDQAECDFLKIVV
jgi:hypothetical protein